MSDAADTPENDEDNRTMKIPVLSLQNSQDEKKKKSCIDKFAFLVKFS